MASDQINFNTSSTETRHNNKNEEDLIDLDKVLPLKLDSNWLLECNGNSTELQDSFSKLHFSNPIIEDMVKSVYQSGKSKQVLNQLLNGNKKMTGSCDNCAFIYKCKELNITDYNQQRVIKRHSMAIISTSKNSLTDSLDTLTIDDNGNDITVLNDRMTQSSIDDYVKEVNLPTLSNALPIVKSVSTSQNILSRTYDKNDLEILKQVQLSQSVFVPNISGSKIDHHESKPIYANQHHTFAKNTDEASSSGSYLKRLFPIATRIKVPSTIDRRPRPISEYPVDKLSRSTINRNVNTDQIQHNNINTKRLLQMNENIFETDVLTPINSPRNIKPLLVTSRLSGLRRSNTCRK